MGFAGAKVSLPGHGSSDIRDMALLMYAKIMVAPKAGTQGCGRTSARKEATGFKKNNYFQSDERAWRRHTWAKD